MRIPTENNAGEFCQTHLITSEPPLTQSFGLLQWFFHTHLHRTFCHPWLMFGKAHIGLMMKLSQNMTLLASLEI
jgi:hypothetical protein